MGKKMNKIINCIEKIAVCMMLCTIPAFAEETEMPSENKVTLVICVGGFVTVCLVMFFAIAQFNKKMIDDKLKKLEKAEHIENILHQTGFRREQLECMNALFGTNENFSVIHSSRRVMDNFRYDEMKIQYLTKYFDLAINEKNVEHIDRLLKCYEDAKAMLIDEYEEVPALTPWDWPTKAIDYTSPAGTIHVSSQFVVDEQGLLFIKKQAQALLSKQSSKKIQRQLMTPELREAIIRRDNWTCQKCGNSVFKEPNLLLEVDHIIPVSKGGKTEPNNLQTLCWKCNREKSDKLDGD